MKSRRTADQHTIPALILAGIVALPLGGCSPRAAPPSPPAEIRLGAVWEPYELGGTNRRLAVELCVREIEEAGGLEIDGRRHPVTLVGREIDNSAESATRATLELINHEGIVALIGASISRLALPMAALSEKAQVPMISPGATHADVTAGHHFVFRASFTDPAQGRLLAEFARRELGARTAAVLFDIADAYNRGVSEAFRDTFDADGGRIVGFETYTTNELDYHAPLRRIADARPDVLLLPNFNTDLPTQIRQAHEHGIRATLLATDALSLETQPDPTLLAGAYYSKQWHSVLAATTPEAQRFNAAFEQSAGHESSTGAALAYDSCGLLLQAIRRADRIDPLALRDALAETRDYPGVTGTISFHGHGDPRRPALIFRVDDQGRSHLLRRLEIDADGNASLKGRSLLPPSG